MPDGPVAKPFDVAISFLTPDADLAGRLYRELTPGLEVFLYTERQRELAGSDGLETLRSPFLWDSRLVVVLYREGWSETPWTRVESGAIKDRYLKEGPDFLLLIMLDESPPPPWVSERLIWFNLGEFPFAEAVGAIKWRARKLGSEIRPPTLEERAAKAAATVAFNKETQEVWRTERGVREVAEEAVRLTEALEANGRRIADAGPNLGLEVGRKDSHVVLRSVNGSMALFYHNAYVNSLDDARLVCRLFECDVLLPEQPGYYHSGHPPDPVAERQFFPARDEMRGWCWREDGGPVWAVDEIAEDLTEWFLERLSAV